MKNFFGDRLHSNNTEENTSPRKIRSLKHIEPVNKQITDQPTPSAQSDSNSIIQGLKRALDKLGNRLSTENREKITKEYNQACIILDVCRKGYEELDNQRKQNPPVPLAAEQQEFIEVFEKASEYNHKAKEYKDQFSIDQKPETFINDLEMVNQKLRKNKLVQDTVFSASVKTDSSGKITIDLAKFVPSAIDLSKLDLSNQEKDIPDTIEVNLTSIDKSSFKRPFIYDLSSTLFLARMALKSGYIYATYNTHAELYRKVLEHYLQTRIYSELKKTNLSQNDFMDFIYYFNENTKRLIVNNNMNRTIEGCKSDKSIHTSHHSSSSNLERSYQDDPETQRKKNELKALFSDNPDERNDAEIKYIEDPKKYFEQEVTRAKEHIKWAERFTQWFPLHDDWIQAGMKQQLGIEPEKFREVHQQLNNLVDALKLDENTTVLPDAQTYKELAMASAKFKVIRELLKDSISIRDEIPKRINGFERVPTSANEQNCLIHALLKVDKPEWDMQKIEKAAKSIRNNFSTKMKKKLDEYTQNQKKAEMEEIYLPLFSERYEAVNNSQMLDLGSYDGQYLINYLREQKMIDPDRSLLIYKLNKEKLQCREDYPTDSNKEPYTLFLYQDYHFEAMIKSPKQEGERPNQADGPSTS